MDKFLWGLVGLLFVCMIGAMLSGCDTGPSKFDTMREQCAAKYEKTTDYLQCKAQVDAAEKRQRDQDNDDAALISTTIMLSTAATVQ